MSAQVYSDGSPEDAIYQPSPAARPENAFIRESAALCEIVHVIGEVDLASAGELAAAIDEAAQSGASVIADLEPCSYIDSTTLSVLMRAGKTYPGRFFIVVPATGMVRRIFTITGLLDHLPVIPSLEAFGRT
jgi:anti-anti-sigma factor